MESSWKTLGSCRMGARRLPSPTCHHPSINRVDYSRPESQKTVTCTHSVVRVSWIDADQSSGWSDFKSKAPWVIHTVGYLVSSGKKKTDFVVLADSHLPDTDQWGGLNRIPMGMVLEIQTIAESVPCGHFYENTRYTRHPS